MADTFQKIASVTVGAGGASSIDFTSIPQTYTDLCVKISARSNRAANIDELLDIKPNGSTTGLTFRFLRGSGSAADSGTVNRAFVEGDGGTANTFANTEIYIPNYTSSANKSISVDSVTENNGTTAYMSMQANLWSNTAAISSLTLAPNLGTLFLQYSTATLYGITKA